MKVFISWSGSKSRNVAEALRDWLPDVIQIIEPWMSVEDIEKGARWASDIANQLSDAKVGIICLTSDNLESSWILFEAGALSKTLDKTFVCPYLLDIEPIDLTGPLVQFQATKSTKEDTKKLLSTINKALGKNSLKSDRFNAAFERFWPDFEEKLKGISETNSQKSEQKKGRSDRDILEEVLELVRGVEREIKSTRSLDFTASRDLLQRIQNKWPDIISQVRKNKIALASFLSDGIPEAIIEQKLVIVFDPKTGFHKNHVNKNKTFIEKAIEIEIGSPLEIVCVTKNEFAT
jgi:hypothetical protein